MPQSKVEREIDRSLRLRLDEGDDLVAVFLRYDEVRPLAVVRQQAIGVGRELEVIALLLDPIDRRAAGRALRPLGIDRQLVLGEIGLVAHRVPARVFVEVDVAGFAHAGPDRLRGDPVARLRRAHALVDMRADDVGHRLELRRRLVGQRLRRDPAPRRRLLHLLAVLVHAGHHQRVVAVERLEAADRVGRDQLVGVADVRRAVGVGDRRRDREGGPVGHLVLQ